MEGISVVIPTYNRVEYIEEVVLSSAHQEHVNEIIIVDDGSDAKAKQILSGVESNHDIVKLVEHRKNKGLPAARNTGIRESESEYVLFGEDDMVFEEDYASKLLKEIKQSRYSISAGRIKNDNVTNDRSDDDYSGIINERLLVGNFTKHTGNTVDVPFVHACALIHNEVFENIRYDEETYDVTYFREETDFYLRASAEGYNILYNPNAIAHHYDTSPTTGASGCSPESSFEAKEWHFINNYRFILKNWNIINKKIGINPIVPLFQYTIRGMANTLM